MLLQACEDHYGHHKTSTPHQQAIYVGSVLLTYCCGISNSDTKTYKEAFSPLLAGDWGVEGVGDCNCH